ncbi:Trichome birefringence-like 23 [Hibiscus syriacus]|uniref:Trichome birefringence-like 23 n=1 Tax=Hibiscus syriacus TaxID=106335 RepID=A0A6A2XJJ7_HIBSY|nr:uncharacterized protein LOC120166867 [Hibiscus syriacus]KAE8675708.1 Trichome birefringence-like 23 [Hibiscus syriacus]
MAEESKARLVRCPKCDSLIKELPQYSLYKCGSCGAALRAKKKDEHGSGVSVKGKNRRKERIFGEKTIVSSRTDKANGFLDDDKNFRLDHDRTEKRDGYVDDCWAHQFHGHHHDINISRSKSVSSSRESDFGVYSPRLDHLTRSLRLKGVESVDRDEFRGLYKRSLETIDEGPSTYGDVPAYGYHKPVKSFVYLDGPNGVRNFDRDRTLLLKKLDELKDQLSRSLDMPQRPRELVPGGDKMASNDHLGGSIGMFPAHTRSARYLNVSKLTYMNHNSMNDDEHMQNFYGNFHSVSKHGHRETHGDYLSPGMNRRPHNQATHQHPQQRTFGYSSAKYLNQEGALHNLPACSCLYCYDENRKGPLRVQPAGFGNRRSLKDPCSSTFNHYVSSNRVGQHYPPRPQPKFEDPPVHLWPSEIDSDTDGFGGRRRPRRVMLTRRSKRLCQPVASGAPFITCYNCLELLRLPRKFRKMMNNEQRLQCGACSTVIVFEMEKKRLVISIPGNPNRTPTDAKATSTDELVTENHPSSHGCFNSGGTIQQSSKEDQSLDNVIVCRDSPGSFDLLFSSDISATVSSLPFQELAKNPSSNGTVSEHRDRTKPEHQEKVILLNNASQGVSGGNSSLVTTKAGVSFNGYRSSSSSRDSLEASKEHSQLKLHKGSKSILVGLIKKSFRDFSKSNDNIRDKRPNVSVNRQPISDYAVREAEKQAGPIHPGNYWYDSRAGFWGVMGQPCSGIIPPFIEEFNYPMPKNCAAGNTGVFINGRELHQKDLELLACKGFPTARDKSYIIEFSGRVFDQDSGIELYTLGKLAPTVEKEMIGFGMRVPRAVE